jgi:hypothetical protein
MKAVVDTSVRSTRHLKALRDDVNYVSMLVQWEYNKDPRDAKLNKGRTSI